MILRHLCETWNQWEQLRQFRPLRYLYNLLPNVSSFHHRAEGICKKMTELLCFDKLCVGWQGSQAIEKNTWIWTHVPPMFSMPFTTVSSTCNGDAEFKMKQKRRCCQPQVSVYSSPWFGPIGPTGWARTGPRLPCPCSWALRIAPGWCASSAGSPVSPRSRAEDRAHPCCTARSAHTGSRGCRCSSGNKRRGRRSACSRCKTLTYYMWFTTHVHV